MSLFDHAVVATESPEVAAVCRSMGAPVELTGGSHESGTERVAEVARLSSYRGFDTIVNIQGDEPLVEESHLRAAVALVSEGGWRLGTCAAPLERGEVNDPAAVKVAVSDAGGALRFFRLGASEASPRVLRHLGIYSFTRSGLLEWAALPPHAAETELSLEQLRPLAHGIPMGVASVGPAAPGVDTPSDLRCVESILRKQDGAVARNGSGMGERRA